MRYLLGIDNGGTFSKAALFDENGKQIAKSSVPSLLITPKPGYVERDMNVIWDGTAAAIRETIAKSGVDPEEICGVSLCGHGKGLYLVGYDGKPSYNGILSTDTRAWEYAERWRAEGIEKKIFPMSYQTVLACQPVSLLAWLRDHEPQVLENTKYIFHVKDYLRYMLTGEAYAGYTDSSGSNLVDLNTKSYSKELLDCFGLGAYIDKLPPLKYSSELCGYITEAASLQCGLAVGTPVAAGMFDVDACGLASGLVDERDICMIAGTWSINEYIAQKPVENGTVALNSMYCIPGCFLVEESSPTSAGNMEWFIRTLMEKEKAEAEAEGCSIYELTNKWVEDIEPQDSGLVFLPFINGSNESPLAKGTFVGLTAYHNKADMLRSVYEGVVFAHYTHVQKLLCNRPVPDYLYLSGGAANSDVWVQIFADVFQLPIKVIEDKEIGAHGAAIAAGVAVGVYKDYREAVEKTVKFTKTIYPRPAYKSVYEAKYQTYRVVIEALDQGGVWKQFKN